MRRPARTLGAAALSLALAACGGLGLAALDGRSGAAADGPARLAGAAPWPAGDPRHVGLSAIETGPDGRRALVLSDRGLALRADLLRDAAGDLVGIRAGAAAPLRDLAGRALPAPDAEGLATPPGALAGPTFVALEGEHRVLRYPDLLARPEARARRLPRPGAWAGLAPGNRGPEALAQTADGAVIAVLEDPGPGGHAVALWRDGAGWRTLAPLPASGWAPVGADMGPDGRLYLLERRFLGTGFRSRVRRFALADGGLGAPETLLTTPLGRHGNLEGIAVWARPGEIRLTMVADDNGLPVQRGGVVEYALPAR